MSPSASIGLEGKIARADRQTAPANSAPILSLFLALGVLQLGHAYSVSQSFPAADQQRILEDLDYYGFIYRGSNGGDYFYPTHLATTLCSGDLAGQMGGVEGEEKRFLILETNYKIYAYTCTCLWAGLLRLVWRRGVGERNNQQLTK